MRSYQAGRRARLLTGAATGLALIAAAGAASAQATAKAEQAADEVVVTGLRASIQNSIAVKKKETSIVEVISAEDIGKLPDNSIADSLARLPGLATQRLDGRANVISIRGLAPDFTTSLLNGREQVSTGDNRGVEFDQYPSELLSQVVVYKTPDATLIGQGLAGTVDLRTVRPLEYGKRAIALNARYEWNDIGALSAGSTDHGQRYTISYIDQFMDGKLGIALGYSHITTPYQSQRFNSWGYPDVSSGVKVIGGSKSYVMSAELKRDAYLATVEFKPSDTVTSTLDVFYTEFDNTQILRGIELPLYWSSASLQPGYTVSNGLVTKGTFNNVKGVGRNDANRRESKLTSIGWNTKWDFADKWSATADLNYSKVDRTDLVLETYSGTGRSGTGALDNISFTSGSDGTLFKGILNYADYGLIKLTQPQGWGAGAVAGITGGQDGYYNSPTTEDELKAIRLEATREMSSMGLKSVEFGANITGRRKSLVANEFFLGLKANPASVDIPAQYRQGATSLAFLSGQGFASYDPIGILNSGLYNLIRNPNGDVRSKNWVVDETVTTLFAKANLDTNVFGVPLTGNYGVAYVNTNQASGGYAATGGGSGTITVPRKDGATYAEWLPSANLIFELPEDTYIRLAAARTLARPRMDQMRGSFNYGFSGGVGATCLTQTAPAASCFSGGGGNPRLKPWLADAYDVSFERYFGGRQGYVAAALFYKNLKSYVYDKSQIYDFTGFPITGPEPATRKGVITTPQNGEGGTIRGAEFSASIPLSLLWEPLDGFGVFASASFTESTIQPNPGNRAQQIPGLSKWVTNVTAYYEKDGFSARISQRYRTGFIGEVRAFGNGLDGTDVKEESVVDGQIGYEFKSGQLKGLSVLGQVYNLTDEPFVTFYNGDERQVRDYQVYGRTFLVGVSYKF